MGDVQCLEPCIRREHNWGKIDTCTKVNRKWCKLQMKWRVVNEFVRSFYQTGSVIQEELIKRVKVADTIKEVSTEIIDGFMIQGGDPNGNGTGGSDTKIKGEFEGNGVKNDISHVRGTISMARSSANDSASSQFFIVQSDSQYLDGEYAGFGTVTEGMEIVDQICKDTPVQDSNGTVAAEDQPVIESVKVID